MKPNKYTTRTFIYFSKEQKYNFIESSTAQNSTLHPKALLYIYNYIYQHKWKQNEKKNKNI